MYAQRSALASMIIHGDFCDTLYYIKDSTMFCTECGEQINDRAVVCVHCDAPTVAPPRGTNQPDAVVRMLLPVGRSGYAIAAGYLGLVSILGIFAPFALLFGILAVKDIRNNPEKHGMGRAIFGIIMGALGLIVLGLIVFPLFLK
ncbi:MAG: DUF4190 domain-containing protein [Verrucomicrobia bacterium]|nr:DUF4190 domain-containing protein [Verrucomicrobiota bacterium]